MSLSADEVRKVALLARLQLTDDEVKQMAEQLGRVLNYIDQLNELDTSSVQPMAHAIDLQNVFAEDQLQSSLPREAVLANAPKADQACYRVPAVLGEV